MRRKAEAHRQAIGVDNGVNLAAYVLRFVACDTGGFTRTTEARQGLPWRAIVSSAS
jgi:hypothetical protein